MNKRAIAFFLFYVSTIALPSTADACQRYVDLNSSTSGNGLSWYSAFNDLQYAINNAQANGNCEVWVTKGDFLVYDGSRSDTLNVHSNIHIYGGFEGWEDSPSQRDIGSNYTNIIAGENYSNPATRAYHAVTVGSNTMLDGFVIAYGLADGTGINAFGAGILAWGGSVTLKNSFFLGNNANYGGAILVFYGELDFDNVVFWLNSAQTRGGGVFAYMSNVDIVNTTFAGNQANDSGGGFFHQGNSLDIDNSTFEQNQATNNGGGLYYESAETDPSLRVSATTFENNSAKYGGGVYNYLKSALLVPFPFTHPFSYSNIKFIENSASRHGAGMYNKMLDTFYGPRIENGLFLRNNAGSLGGAMYNFKDSGDTSAGASIYNSTFVDNVAGISGYSGIRNFRPRAYIAGSIFWGNGTGSGIADGGGASSNVQYSSTQTSWTGIGTGNRYGDPSFFRPTHDNYRLAHDSDCIDSGSHYAPERDLDDLLRLDVVDIPNTGSGSPANHADMGAYEYHSFYRHDLNIDGMEESVLPTCMNGEAADYYVRPGFGYNSDRWIIYLQGGGFCNSATGPTGCDDRNLNQIRPYNETEMPHDGKNDVGILSYSPAQNDKFYNYNQVYLHYCSSDLWTGTGGELTFVPKETTSSIDGKFRGSNIVQAVLAELTNVEIMSRFDMPVITDARDVMVAGSSAGGFGVLNHLDRIRDVLAYYSGTDIPVKGLADASYTVDTARVNGQATTINEACDTPVSDPSDNFFALVLSGGLELWDGIGGLDQSCRQWIATTPDQDYTKCLSGDFLFDPPAPATSFIDQSKVFMHMSQLDTAMLQPLLGMSEAELYEAMDEEPWTLTTEQEECAEAFRLSIFEAANLFDAGFFEYQLNHATLHKAAFNPDSDSLQIDGITMYKVVTDWYNDETETHWIRENPPDL